MASSDVCTARLSPHLRKIEDMLLRPRDESESVHWTRDMRNSPDEKYSRLASYAYTYLISDERNQNTVEDIRQLVGIIADEGLASTYFGKYDMDSVRRYNSRTDLADLIAEALRARDCYHN